MRGDKKMTEGSIGGLVAFAGVAVLTCCYAIGKRYHNIQLAAHKKRQHDLDEKHNTALSEAKQLAQLRAELETEQRRTAELIKEHNELKATAVPILDDDLVTYEGIDTSTRSWPLPSTQSLAATDFYATTDQKSTNKKAKPKSVQQQKQQSREIAQLESENTETVTVLQQAVAQIGNDADAVLNEQANWYASPAETSPSTRNTMH